MASKLDLPLRGTSVNIVRQCGGALSDVLQSKFGCKATIHGVDFGESLSTAQQKRPTVRPERRFSTGLRSGVHVSVWKADLTNFQVDAVVNAANEHLQHFGGLALALSKAGGPQIQRDSDDYVNMKGSLKTGDAIVSNPGSLPCKMLIHAVGPKLSTPSDVYWAESLLIKAIWNILDRVKENNLQSVAIPAISSGLFNYPLHKCADTIVTAVKNYYDNKSWGHLPKDIMLVNHDEATVKEMERACQRILSSNSPMKFSFGASSKNKGDDKTSTPTVQRGSVHLTLKRGKIEEQHADVIVNTIFDGNPNSGKLSKALLQKAGQGMQTEIMSAPRTKSDVIVTKSYSLQCKEVYHVFWKQHAAQSLAAQQASDKQILFHSVNECLRLAAAAKHTHIAFPAMGTGGVGIGKSDAAYIMSDAVDNFASKYPEKMEVDLVILPSEKDTFKAFEQQIRRLQEKPPNPGFTSGFESRDKFTAIGAASESTFNSEPVRPQITLSGPSEEATREAERWLQGLLIESSGTVYIYNNLILHFGEKEHQQLSDLMKKGVSIKEFFEKGRASIVIRGDSSVDVAVVGFQVEAMLCNIQREFVREEECALLRMSGQNVSIERKETEYYTSVMIDRKFGFKSHRPRSVKVEMVENATLKMLFDLKKQQLRCSSSRTMFQRIPAQFCEMVFRIGFHAEFAPPDDPAFGEGIYFASSLETAMTLWKEQSKEYVHFVEAEVLTGESTPGKRGLILPPAVGKDPKSLYDSVSGGAEISVIFSSYQALPKSIITCKF